MPLDPEDMLSDWERRAEQQTQLTMELSQRMQQNTATVESHGGEAVVTVDHTGGLAALQISDAAMRIPSNDLASVILATSRRAQAKMAQQMADLVKGMYGSDSATAAFITDTYTGQFPEQPEDEERGRP